LLDQLLVHVGDGAVQPRDVLGDEGVRLALVEKVEVVCVLREEGLWRGTRDGGSKDVRGGALTRPR